MISIDLSGQPIKKNDIKNVISQLSLVDVFIRADTKGFEEILKLYKDWFSSPQYSAEVVYASGAYVDTGGEFILQTTGTFPAVVNFYDTSGLDEGAVVAQLINYN